jgi:hypothetical protein
MRTVSFVSSERLLCPKTITEGLSSLRERYRYRSLDLLIVAYSEDANSLSSKETQESVDFYDDPANQLAVLLLQHTTAVPNLHLFYKTTLAPIVQQLLYTFFDPTYGRTQVRRPRFFAFPTVAPHKIRLI